MRMCKPHTIRCFVIHPQAKLDASEFTEWLMIVNQSVNYFPTSILNRSMKYNSRLVIRKSYLWIKFNSTAAYSLVACVLDVSWSQATDNKRKRVNL